MRQIKNLTATCEPSHKSLFNDRRHQQIAVTLVLLVLFHRLSYIVKWPYTNSTPLGHPILGCDSMSGMPFTAATSLRKPQCSRQADGDLLDDVLRFGYP